MSLRGILLGGQQLLPSNKNRPKMLSKREQKISERRRSRFVGGALRFLRWGRWMGLLSGALLLLLLLLLLVVSPPHATMILRQEPYIIPNTWTGECRAHYLRNRTWGKLVAPLVDKLGVKDLVENMGTAVKVVPTIAHYDASNISLFTLETMRSLPESYIIKPTHTSGGTARVRNGMYHCFKSCRYGGNKPVPLGEAAFQLAKKNMEWNLKRSFGIGKESQYEWIPHRILVEEHLPIEKISFTPFWVVHGKVIWSKVGCDDTNTDWVRGSFVTTNFARLNLTIKRPHCGCPVGHQLKKPKAWGKMISIAENLGRHVPGGMLVRLDLYADDNDKVYFSEFTFTSAKCKYYANPIEADQLLYSVLHSLIDPEQVTPHYVEHVINSAAAASSNTD